MRIVVIFDFFHEPLKPVLITFAPLWRLTNIAPSSAKINPYFRSVFMIEMLIMSPAILLLLGVPCVALLYCNNAVQHFRIANISSASRISAGLIRKSANQLFTIHN
jgi:hypothetical protein